MGAAKDTLEALERVGEVDVVGPTWRKDLRLKEESWRSGEGTGGSRSSSFGAVGRFLFDEDFVQANREGRFGCRGTWGIVSGGGRSE